MQSTNNTSAAILPLAISIVTILGVLLHDTQIGKATQMAISERAVLGESVSLTRINQHIHMDSGIFTGAAFSSKTAQPAAQPRNTDDKKYIAQRRYLSNSAGTDYSLPKIPSI